MVKGELRFEIKKEKSNALISITHKYNPFYLYHKLVKLMPITYPYTYYRIKSSLIFFGIHFFQKGGYSIFG